MSKQALKLLFRKNFKVVPGGPITKTRGVGAIAALDAVAEEIDTKVATVNGQAPDPETGDVALDLSEYLSKTATDLQTVRSGVNFYNGGFNIILDDGDLSFAENTWFFCRYPDGRAKVGFRDTGTPGVMEFFSEVAQAIVLAQDFQLDAPSNVAEAYNSLSKVAAAVQAMLAGANGAVDTFIEAYNRFVQDESAAAAVNAAISQLQATAPTSDQKASFPAGASATSRLALLSQVAGTFPFAGTVNGQNLVGGANLDNFFLQRATALYVNTDAVQLPSNTNLSGRALYANNAQLTVPTGGLLQLAGTASGLGLLCAARVARTGSGSTAYVAVAGPSTSAQPGSSPPPLACFRILDSDVALPVRFTAANTGLLLVNTHLTSLTNDFADPANVSTLYLQGSSTVDSVGSNINVVTVGGQGAAYDDAAVKASIFGRNRGPWVANTAYKKYDWVLQGGQTYYAKSDFTSGASFTAANWTLFGGLSQTQLDQQLASEVLPYLFTTFTNEKLLTNPATAYLADSGDALRLPAAGTFNVNIAASTGGGTGSGIISFRVPKNGPGCTVNVSASGCTVDGSATFTLAPGDFRLIGIDYATQTSAYTTRLFVPGTPASGGGGGTLVTATATVQVAGAQSFNVAGATAFFDVNLRHTSGDGTATALSHGTGYTYQSEQLNILAAVGLQAGDTLEYSYLTGSAPAAPAPAAAAGSGIDYANPLTLSAAATLQANKAYYLTGSGYQVTLPAGAIGDVVFVQVAQAAMNAAFPLSGTTLTLYAGDTATVRRTADGWKHTGGDITPVFARLEYNFDGGGWGLYTNFIPCRSIVSGGAIPGLTSSSSGQATIQVAGLYAVKGFVITRSATAGYVEAFVQCVPASGAPPYYVASSNIAGFNVDTYVGSENFGAEVRLAAGDVLRLGFYSADGNTTAYPATTRCWFSLLQLA